MPLAGTLVHGEDMTAGDEGFDDFYKTSFDKVVSAVAAFGADPDEAFDIAQDAFARALVRWNRLRGEPWAEGWVMTTAMNLCRKRGRRLQRRFRGDETSPTYQETDLVHAELILAIRRLPVRQREAVVLFYLADRPVSQVAELMKISEGAVKAHLSQARAKLRTRLEPRDA